MAQPPTPSLSDQTHDIVQKYEFRVNPEPSTRPTLEARRRGTHHWVILGFIPPDSNYYSIMVGALVECASKIIPALQEEEEQL